MPESVVIGAFVLGAVLLLIAFVGGGFKLFGAEVTGAAKPAARGTSGVLGLLLVLFAIGTEGERNPADPARPGPAADTTRRERPSPVRENGLGSVPDPKALATTPTGPDPAAVREEAVAAVREALDVQVRAMNEGTGDELDGTFEGAARQEAAMLPAVLPTLLQQNGVDPAYFQASGGTMRASALFDDVLDVETNDAGSQAGVRFRYTLRLRLAGPEGCVVLRQNPHTVTYRLNRTADGWRVFDTGPPTMLPWSQEPC